MDEIRGPSLDISEIADYLEWVRRVSGGVMPHVSELEDAELIVAAAGADRVLTASEADKMPEWLRFAPQGGVLTFARFLLDGDTYLTRLNPLSIEGLDARLTALVDKYKMKLGNSLPVEIKEILDKALALMVAYQSGTGIEGGLAKLVSEMSHLSFGSGVSPSTLKDKFLRSASGLMSHIPSSNSYLPQTTVWMDGSSGATSVTRELNDALQRLSRGESTSLNYTSYFKAMIPNVASSLGIDPKIIEALVDGQITNAQLNIILCKVESAGDNMDMYLCLVLGLLTLLLAILSMRMEYGTVVPSAFERRLVSSPNSLRETGEHVVAVRLTKDTRPLSSNVVARSKAGPRKLGRELPWSRISNQIYEHVRRGNNISVLFLPVRVVIDGEEYLLDKIILNDDCYKELESQAATSKTSTQYLRSMIWLVQMVSLAGAVYYCFGKEMSQKK